MIINLFKAIAKTNLSPEAREHGDRLIVDAFCKGQQVEGIKLEPLVEEIRNEAEVV